MQSLMEALFLFNSIVFAISLSGILLVFLLYPLLLSMVFFIKGERAVTTAPVHPPVSLITVVHNGEDLVVGKIQNSLSLNYPSDNFEIIVYSDGSTDGTERKAESCITQNVRFISSPHFEGKNNALNRAVENAQGDILVFSDADAILDVDAILNLIKYFVDPSVGGACGQRVIGEDNKKLKKAQSDYIRFDSTIKKMENKIGSISSNDGKLYAVRKELFQPIPSAVTDDLYVCLSIVKQGYRFLFEPNSRAFIKVPSRSPKHELERRRRIVCRSLRGIFLQKELLNPLKYGIFSLSLVTNKLNRRLLPAYLLVLFLSSAFLSLYNALMRVFFFSQVAFYLLALSYPFLENTKGLGVVKKLSSLPYYFCIGNYGTLLGLIDFIMGKQITKWQPFKTET